MIGSVLTADVAVGSLSSEGTRAGAASGAFADAMRRAEEGARPEDRAPVSAAERDEAWERRVEEQRANRVDPERLARAQEGAEQLVATTFIVPILQQLRESNSAEAPFGPGMYEKRMGPMLDAQIADRIVSAQRLPIVEAVRDRMLGRPESRLEPEDQAEGTS